MFSKFEILGIMLALLCTIATYLVDRREQDDLRARLARCSVAEQLGQLEQRQYPRVRILREPTACI